MTRAVLEGVAMAFADNLAALSAAGATVTRALAVGGGSRSRRWLRIIANALNIAIDVPEEGDFGAGLGAARLGMIAATGADPFAVCSQPKIRETIEPDRNLVPAYAAAHAAYKKLYPAIKEATLEMSARFFAQEKPIKLAGPKAGKELAFRWYDPNKKVLGKRMEDQLRFAVCYWHSFTWPGGDPFGGETFMRPWMHMSDEMEGGQGEGRRRLRDVPAPGRSVLHLPRSRHRAGGRDAR